MANANLAAIPYSNSLGYFQALRHLPWPIWLDSGPESKQRGRFDILSANPRVSLVSKNNQVTVTLSETNTQRIRQGNPLDILNEYLPACIPPTNADIPFCGGAMGYFAYDLGRQLESLPAIALDDTQLPDMQVGIYDWAVIQDHQLKRSYLTWLPDTEKGQVDKIKGLLEGSLKDLNPFNINKLESNLNVDSYSRIFARTQDYIQAGDCYQVNLAQRFSGEYQGDPLTAYTALRNELPSPFSGFFEPTHGAILSLSPERFIQANNQQVVTQPIKGTIARGNNPEQDAHNADTLLHSPKDRAENLMIVDLLRNDLSKVCKEGSVSTTGLFELESFANVHHLVSTIEGELNDNETPISLLKHCFPGGSITGAPKIRAMEIIEELEPCRRSVYCGSLGYISASGQMDTNIAIRTLVCDEQSLMHCWGGGGIVADSTMETEYQESLAKIGVILDTLQKL